MWYVAIFVLGIAIAAVVVLALREIPGFSPAEERLERVVVATLQREAAERFLITGRLDLTASVQVTNTRVLLPDLLDLNIGSARARVRVPGSVSYGFDVSALSAQDIEIRDDGAVVVAVPDLEVYAVDPDLSRLEVETRSGWLRLDDAEKKVTQEALRHLRSGLERQATAHLHDSVQPRMNTATALEALLEPVLTAAGIENPQVQVRLGGGALYEGSD